jgi:hypothetical protein
MHKKAVSFHRRQFLKSAVGVGAAILIPQVIPGTVLGKDGGVAPSERIVMAGLGIGTGADMCSVVFFTNRMRSS